MESQRARRLALRWISVVFMSSVGTCAALGRDRDLSPVERTDQNGGAFGDLWPGFVGAGVCSPPAGSEAGVPAFCDGGSP